MPSVNDDDNDKFISNSVSLLVWDLKTPLWKVLPRLVKYITIFIGRWQGQKIISYWGKVVGEKVILQQIFILKLVKNVLVSNPLKGTLMQIWKSANIFVFIWK